MSWNQQTKPNRNFSEQRHKCQIINLSGYKTTTTNRVISQIRLIGLTQQHRTPWSTMKCSQTAAWTMHRSLLVESRDTCDVIECNQCITSHSGSAPASPGIPPTRLVLSNMHANHYLHPCPHPTHQGHDKLH